MKKQNLNEELYRILDLMKVSSIEEFGKSLFESIISEQDVEINDRWSTINVRGAVYINFPDNKKMSRNQLIKLIEENPDIFKDAMRKAINQKMDEFKVNPLSEENLEKLSQYYINKIKTDRSFNRDVRKSIASRKDSNAEGVIEFKIDAYPSKAVSKIMVTTTETGVVPKFELYNDQQKKIGDFETISKVSEYVNNLNFENLDGSQYFVNVKKIMKSDGSTNSYLFLSLSDQGKVLVSTPVESEGVAGERIEGEVRDLREKLDINYGDVFQAGVTSNVSVDQIKQLVLQQINIKLVELQQKLKSPVKLVSIESSEIIGSATNAWFGGKLWLPPTHKQGDPFNAPASSGPDSTGTKTFATWAQNVDFTVAPINNQIVGEKANIQRQNVNLAWSRISDVASALNSINSDLGLKNVDNKLNWRVTDTGGRLGPEGQFVTTSLVLKLEYQEKKPDVETEGRNVGEIRNYIYDFIPVWTKKKGSMVVSSGTERSKILKGNQKFRQKRRISGFSGYGK